MLMQPRFALSIARRLLPGLCVVLALLAIGMPAHAQQLRGIFVNPGDTATTYIMPVGDVDQYVFDAFADSMVEIEVRRIRDSSLSPGLELIAPDGSQIDISSRLRERRAKARLRSFEVSETGRYAIRVVGRNETEGEYRLKLKVTPPRRKRIRFALDQGKSREVVFGAEDDTRINVIYNPEFETWEFLSGMSRSVACGPAVTSGNSLLTNITSGAEVSPLTLGYTRTEAGRTEMNFGPILNAIMNDKTEIMI